MNSIFVKKNNSDQKIKDKPQKGFNKEVDSSVNTFESSKNINEYFKSKMNKLQIKCNIFDNSNSEQEKEDSQGVKQSKWSSDDQDCQTKLEDGEQLDKDIKSKNKRKYKDVNNLADVQIGKLTKRHKKSKNNNSKNTSSDSSSHSSDSNSSNVSQKVTEKFEIRVPKGYNKNTLSVIESLKNYQHLSLSIMQDKVLSTSNLISIKGYGCHSE